MPTACQLPEGYLLEVSSGRRACRNCSGTLRHVRTSPHQPVGILLGRPQVRLIEQQCVQCGEKDSLENYYQHVPPKNNYTYDLMVEIGLSRYRDHQQDAEIQRQLQTRWGLSVPASSIGHLARCFLDGLAVMHEAYAPALRQHLVEREGFALHLDGTCEAGTDVVFVALAEPMGWVLEATKMNTENTAEISRLLERCVKHFGKPRAVMRDLSSNIAGAVHEILPDTLDLICHYHFLENVGSKLCGKPHCNLTKVLRQLKVRAVLTSLRKDLVRWSKKGGRLSRQQIKHLRAHPREIADLNPLALRRYVAYMVLRWVDDWGADLHGEYFPFDLPSLAFYRRARDLGNMLNEIVTADGFPQRQLPTLKTIARHIAPLCEDEDVLAAVARLEKAEALFLELRSVLRLSHHSDERLLRGTIIPNDHELVKRLGKRLEKWRAQLHKRQDRESDPDRRADQQVVLGYLEKYQKELVGHAIPAGDRRQPFVVARTNNPAEHRFATIKQAIRRKVGVKKLTRYIHTMSAEELLVANLSDPQYLEIVCDGNLANLASRFATHWSQVQSLRARRTQDRIDHPMPTSKKQLRDPKLLVTIEQTIITMVETLSEKPHAA